MSGKLEIEWSPIKDRFITWGSEIFYYEIQPISENPTNAQTVKISNTLCANVLSTNSNHPYVKSIDIYPKSFSDLLLAIGLSNGRVVLSGLGPSAYDTSGVIGKELISAPRHGRQCNVVAFNRLENNLLVAGLDKYRSDNSLLIWDITKYTTNSNSLTSKAYFNFNNTNELIRPVVEFGTSESINSLVWMNTNSKLLACGVNIKSLKLFDIREPDKVANSTQTKAVFGVSVDPHDDKRLASFYENQVSIWDLRNFDKPLTVLPHNRPILKIEWCPTKFSLIGVLQRDCNAITLHDIQETATNSSDDVEPTVLERIVVPELQQSILSFSWHNADENRLLAIDTNGTIRDYTVFDRITLNWSTAASLVWTYGRKTMKYINDSSVPDISNEMKERAKKGYGLEDEACKNANFVRNNQMLVNVWKWIDLSGKLVEEGVISETDRKHPGVTSLIRTDNETNKASETVTTSWSSIGYPNCQGHAKYYRHEDRNKALSLCNWPTEQNTENLTKFIDQLEKEKAYTRAAAIAVFNLKISTAIDVLSRAPTNSEFTSNLNVVAMALSGFSDDKTSVWRQFCALNKTKLSDSYLKAIFAFLTTESHNYDNILYDNRILVDDRVAFACKYLSDGKLLEYLKKLEKKLIEQGHLNGLLLTGNSAEGLKLLQKYLNTTADIQSTSLIAVRAFSDFLYQQNVRDWIDHYRNLLDTWRLWYSRADFDIMLANYRTNEKPPQQVYVSCNFCGKSISAFMHGLNRGRGAYTRLTGTTNKVKLTSCPNCRKPLPRCSICLMYMGTSIVDDHTGTDFNNWFTWCQSCRHGGHAGHVMDWFDLHQECPVTGCSCKCLAIDFPCGSSM